MLPVLSALLSLLLLAPDDPQNPEAKKPDGDKPPAKQELNEAGKLVRTAWASQYEWKEDEIESVTISFNYSHHWRRKDAGEGRWEGRGELLVVGDELVRVHLPGRNQAERNAIRARVAGVLARFMRKPFSEVFKDAKFTGPEKLARDILRVKVGGRSFLIKDDKFVGEEQWRGPPKKGQQIRIEFTTGPLGGGYGVMGKSESYTIDSRKTQRVETLEVREQERAPSPKRFVVKYKSPSFESTDTIDFATPEFDKKDAVAIDPAARKVFQAAWERRYTLPHDVRIQGLFERDADRGTWLRRKVEGEFQVWGMDKIDAVLDDRGQKYGNAEQVRTTCRDHLIAGFDFVRAAKFEEEFKNCGFRLEDGAKVQTVAVIGHGRRISFRLKDGAIVGHADLESPDRWFEYKVKKGRDDLMRIQRIDIQVDKTRHRIEFKYKRSRGIEVPKQVGLFVPPGALGRNPGGVVHYKLTRLKTTKPE